MQVKNRTTPPPGRRAVYTRGHHSRRRPPQIRFGPGGSWKQRTRAVSQVWETGGLEADWLLHCVGIATLREQYLLCSAPPECDDLFFGILLELKFEFCKVLKVLRMGGGAD